jgi:ribosomal-protein-alanine N-acetyltransferase
MFHRTNFTELQTSRLHIRELTMNDEEALKEFTADPEAMRFFTMIDTKDPKASTQWIERQLKRYEDTGMGLWALIDKQSGSYVGQCGLLVQEVDETTELEIGYNLLTRCRGNGYASEAAAACREYAFKNKLAPSLISIIHVDNVNSQRVAVRNGMERDKQTTFKEIPVYVYRIKSSQK